MKRKYTRTYDQVVCTDELLIAFVTKVSGLFLNFGKHGRSVFWYGYAQTCLHLLYTSICHIQLCK
jgi:hypothetical protein